MREEFSDLYLVVGGNLIAVHQLVLSAHSTHLASLLATHTQAGGGGLLSYQLRRNVLRILLFC